VTENFEVVGLVFEVPEGREHVDSEIEALWSAKAAHVFEKELHGDARSGSPRTRLLEQEGRAIDTRHREPAFREGNGVPTWAAAEIEDRARLHTGQGESPIHLLFGNREGGVREHEGIQLAPERLVSEPFVRS